jgi:dTDP-4-amino-4,6-dideoxy-D-galactose acyltransferase
LEKDCILFIVNEGSGILGSEYRIRRCLRIAEHLRENHDVLFFAPDTVRDTIREKGCEFIESDLEDIKSFTLSLERLSVKVAVFDLPKVPLEFILLLRGLGALIVAMDDGSEYEDYIDIRINPVDIDKKSDFGGLRYWVPDPKWLLDSPEHKGGQTETVVFKVQGEDLGYVHKLQEIGDLLDDRGYAPAIFIPGKSHTFAGHSNVKNMIMDFQDGAHLLHGANLIVNVGLSDLFDLLQLNRPVACLRKSEDEGDLINNLLPDGGVFDLGVLDHKEALDFCDHIINILNEPESLAYHTALLTSLVSKDNVKEVCDIINVVKILSWDTDFFGFPVAFLSSLKLNTAIVRFVFDFCSRNQVKLLEYQCDCHDRESVLLAERHGFNFADIRLTFERFIRGEITTPPLPSEFHFDMAHEGDIDRLVDIADGLYLDSRYYFDTNFPRDKVRKFYSDWVRKAVLGTFDDCAMILRHGQNPVGFCTVKYEPNFTARIRLVGIDPRYRAKGLAKTHLMYCLKELISQGIHYVQVATQGRNYSAQRLYQKAGFVTKKTELWYHKWFQEEKTYHV